MGGRGGVVHEQYGLEPDMVTLAKGLGGGVPVAALLMTDGVARSMPAGGHGSTGIATNISVTTGKSGVLGLLLGNSRGHGGYGGSHHGGW